MLVNRPIPNLWNGISQQAAPLRRSGQAEAQINAHGDIVHGLRKRPSTSFVANLAASASIGGVGCRAWIFEVTGVGDFLIIATNDATYPLEAFNLSTGARVTVNYDASAKSYLTTNISTVNASQRVKALVVSSTMFLLNTTVTVTAGGAAPGSLTGTVQSFDKLPTTPTAGWIYKISGNETNKFNSYYVRWDGAVWAENWNQAESPGTPTNTTMPVLLTYGAGSFSLALGTWTGRAAGDSVTNPIPSFVGGTINEMFYTRGRFGLISKNNVIFSQIGNAANFYATSVVDILDDDPIDIAVSMDSVDNLRHAVAFDKNLLVLGDKTQFNIGSGESTTLTTKTVAATPTTRFEIEPYSAPFSVGANVYFLTRGTAWSSVREYYVEDGSLLQDAADITAHVPKLIPAGTALMTGINIEDILFIRSEGDADVLFVYKYFWVKDEKAQSSWSKWTFDGDISAMVAYQKNLYLVMKRGTTLTLEKIDMEYPTRFEETHLHLDRWTTPLSKTYGSGKTVLAWPFNVETATDTHFVVVNATDEIIYDISDFTDESNGDISLPGDLSGKTLYGGFLYDMEYTLTEFYLTNDDGIPMLQTKLGLRFLRLEYQNTGYFTVRVESIGRDVRETATADATANLEAVGDWSSVNIGSGEGIFEIFLDSKEARVTVLNDTLFPCQLVAGSYDVFYTERSRFV